MEMRKWIYQVPLKSVLGCSILHYSSASNDNDPTLKNCLFGGATLTKNTDIDKYGYSGYGTGFNRKLALSFPVLDLVKMY